MTNHVMSELGDGQVLVMVVFAFVQPQDEMIKPFEYYFIPSASVLDTSIPWFINSMSRVPYDCKSDLMGHSDRQTMWISTMHRDVNDNRLNPDRRLDDTASSSLTLDACHVHHVN